MNVTLLAPYGRSETALAAQILADCLLDLGCHVQRVSMETHQTGDHWYWDRRVRSSRRRGLCAAARKADWFISFVPSAMALDEVKLVAENAATALIVPWLATPGLSVAAVDGYDHWICPTETVAQTLLGALAAYGPRREGDARQPVIVHWDPAVPDTAATLREGQQRVLLALDPWTQAACSRGPLLVVERLLDACPDIQLTLLYTASWSRLERQYLRLLGGAHPERLRLCAAANSATYLVETGRHDWTILPTVRSTFGLWASRAMACGCPVIAHDLPPFSELVTTSTGVLVPCEVLQMGTGAPTAIFNSFQFSDRCAKALLDEPLCQRLRSTPRDPRRWHQRFRAFWAQLLRH